MCEKILGSVCFYLSLLYVPHSFTIYLHLLHIALVINYVNRNVVATQTICTRVQCLRKLVTVTM